MTLRLKIQWNIFKALLDWMVLSQSLHLYGTVYWPVVSFLSKRPLGLSITLIRHVCKSFKSPPPSLCKHFLLDFIKLSATFLDTTVRPLLIKISTFNSHHDVDLLHTSLKIIFGHLFINHLWEHTSCLYHKVTNAPEWNHNEVRILTELCAWCA